MGIRLGNIPVGKRVTGSATRNGVSVPFDVPEWARTGDTGQPGDLAVSITLEENLAQIGPGAVVAKAVVTGGGLSNSADTDIVPEAGVAGYDQGFGEARIAWITNDAIDAFDSPALRTAHHSRNQGVGARFCHVYRAAGTYEITATVWYRGQFATATVPITVDPVTWTDAETILIASDGDYSWYTGNANQTAYQFDRLAPAFNNQSRINSIASDKARILLKPGDTIADANVNWRNDDLQKHIWFGTEWGQTPATIDLRGNTGQLIEFEENDGFQIIVQNINAIGGVDPSSEEPDPSGGLNVLFRGANARSDVIIDRVHATGFFNFMGSADVGRADPLAGRTPRIILHDCRHDNGTDFMWLGGSNAPEIGMCLIGCRARVPSDALYGGQNRNSYADAGTYGGRNSHNAFRHSYYRYAMISQTEFTGFHGWVITSPQASKNNLPLLQNGIRWNTGSETGIEFQMTQCYSTVRINSGTNSGPIAGGNEDPQRSLSLFEANTFVCPPSAPFLMSIHHSGTTIVNNHFIVPDMAKKTIGFEYGFFGNEQDHINRPNMVGWPVNIWGNTFEFLGTQANIGAFDPNDLFAGLIQNDGNGFNNTNYLNVNAQGNVVYAPNLDLPLVSDGPFTRTDTPIRMQTDGVAFGWHIHTHDLVADVPNNTAFEVPYAGQTDTFGRAVTQADFSAYDGRAGIFYNVGNGNANFFESDQTKDFVITFTPTGIQFLNQTGQTLMAGHQFDFNISRGANHEAPHPDTVVDHTAQNLVPQPGAGAYQSATGPDIPHRDINGNIRSGTPSRGAFEPI